MKRKEDYVEVFVVVDSYFEDGYFEYDSAYFDIDKAQELCDELNEDEERWTVETIKVKSNL
jgi:hypothetical protein